MIIIQCRKLLRLRMSLDSPSHNDLTLDEDSVEVLDVVHDVPSTILSQKCC